MEFQQVNRRQSVSKIVTGQAIKLGPFLSRNDGYSLIELVLVIVIVGILSVAAIPKFANIDTFRSRTYSDEIFNSVRYAQKLAVGMGCEIQVSNTATTLTLRVRDSCTSGGFNTDIRPPGFWGSSFVKTAPSGVTISASSDFPIYFDRLGRAHESGGAVSNASITVSTRTFQIVGETGFVYEP